MVFRIKNLNEFESIGLRKVKEKEFEGVYRNYKCIISFKNVGVGLAPTLLLTVQFNIGYDDEKKSKRLNELAYKYKKYSFKWHFNALTQVWTFNLFMPKFEKMLSNLNTLIDILEKESLEPEAANELDKKG